jgi:hypothetical protein
MKRPGNLNINMDYTFVCCILAIDLITEINEKLPTILIDSELNLAKLLKSWLI